MTKNRQSGARADARRKGLAAWRTKVGEDSYWKYNLGKSIARLERRLANSMAFITEPEPRDMARWQGWRREITEKRAALAAIERGEPPEAPRPWERGLRKWQRRASDGGKP
jgi:hypothetical protein